MTDADSVRRLIGDAPIVAFSMNLDGVLTAVEGGGLAAVGIDIQSGLGRSVFEVFRNDEEIVTSCRRALRGEQFTVVVRTGDRAFETRYTPSYDEHGTLRGTVGVSLEVTSREHAIAELRTSEERFRAFIEHAHDAIVEIDPAARVLYASPRFSEITGYPQEHLGGKNGMDYVHSDDLEMVNELRAHAMETETEVEMIFRFRHRDGSWRWIELGGRPFRTATDELRAVLMVRDVTQRIRLEQNQLGQLELETRMGELSRRLMLVDSSDFADSMQQELKAAGAMAGADRCYIVSTDPAGATARTFEWSGTGIDPRVSAFSNDSPRKNMWITRKLIAGEVIQIPDIDSLPDELAEMRETLRGDGVLALLLIPVLDAHRLVAVMGLQCVRAKKDWSDHEIHILSLAAGLFNTAIRGRGAEAALQASNERFRALAENAQDAIMEIGSDSAVLYVNPACEALLGYTADELKSMPILDSVHPEDRPRLEQMFRLSSGEQGDSGSALYRGVHRDGSERWFDARGRGFHDAAGEFRMVVVIRDATERETNQRALERQLSLEKEIAILSRRFLSLSGSEVDEGIRAGVAAVGELAEVDRCWLVPMGDAGQWAELAFGWHRDGAEAPADDLNAFAFGRYPWAQQIPQNSELIHVHRVSDLPPEVETGRQVLIKRGTLSFLGIPLLSDRGVVGFMGFETLYEERVWDDEMIRLLRLVGEIFVGALSRKRAELALANSQAQLVQSQKMEAVGTLAGGIAHDFNNQLAVILGNTRHLARQIGSQPDTGESLKDLERAAEHCAQLTRSLLAFSRRTPVESSSIDLGDLLRDVKKLLAPLIPTPIRFEVEAAGDLNKVMADPTQLQQVIVNLGVNSRDAMPNGGELLIRARNVHVDAERAESLGLSSRVRYVEISVADTGTGMDEPTQSRIFDPFFTTKPLGEGTGLGLATAYGIVHDSGGAIEVESAPSAGANFRVLLPCSVDKRDKVSDALDGAVDAREPAVCDETVMLVEDEQSVRRLVNGMLERRGYTVLQATDGIDALRISQTTNGVIDMVVTDLVMPNLNGEELVSRLLLDRPEMAVLFISGFSDREPEIPNSKLLAKPFKEEGLQIAVRELLDRKVPVED